MPNNYAQYALHLLHLNETLEAPINGRPWGERQGLRVLHPTVCHRALQLLVGTLQLPFQASGCHSVCNRADV